MVKKYTKNFTVENLHYRLDIAACGSVSFNVVAGATFRNAFVPDWNEDYTDYGMKDRTYFANARKVFRQVEAIVLEYIKTNRPHLLYFTSNTDKKQKIYRKIVKKFALQVPDYMVLEAVNVFYFIRKDN